MGRFHSKKGSFFQLVAATDAWVLRGSSRCWRPPTEVLEQKDRLIVRVEVAGMEREQFAIDFDENILSVRGQRRDPVPKQAYWMMEIPFGEFLTEIELPRSYAINRAEITAKYTSGFLLIELPKAVSRAVDIRED